MLCFTFSMTSDVYEAKTETRVACHTILETTLFAFYIKIHFLRKFTNHLDEVELKVLSTENLMDFTFTCLKYKWSRPTVFQTALVLGSWGFQSDTGDGRCLGRDWPGLPMKNLSPKPGKGKPFTVATFSSWMNIPAFRTFVHLYLGRWFVGNVQQMLAIKRWRIHTYPSDCALPNLLLSTLSSRHLGEATWWMWVLHENLGMSAGL